MAPADLHDLLVVGLEAWELQQQIQRLHGTQSEPVRERELCLLLWRFGSTSADNFKFYRSLCHVHVILRQSGCQNWSRRGIHFDYSRIESNSHAHTTPIFFRLAESAPPLRGGDFFLHPPFFPGAGRLLGPCD